MDALQSFVYRRINFAKPQVFSAYTFISKVQLLHAQLDMLFNMEPESLASNPSTINTIGAVPMGTMSAGIQQQYTTNAAVIQDIFHNETQQQNAFYTQPIMHENGGTKQQNYAPIYDQHQQQQQQQIFADQQNQSSHGSFTRQLLQTTESFDISPDKSSNQSGSSTGSSCSLSSCCSASNSSCSSSSGASMDEALPILHQSNATYNTTQLHLAPSNASKGKSVQYLTGPDGTTYASNPPIISLPASMMTSSPANTYHHNSGPYYETQVCQVVIVSFF